MQNPDLIIRKAALSDSVIICELAASTFRAAFAANNNPHNADTYIAQNFSQEQITRELTDKASTFLLACHQDDTIGYAKLYAGEAPECIKSDSSVELVRIYVDPLIKVRSRFRIDASVFRRIYQTRISDDLAWRLGALHIGYRLP